MISMEKSYTAHNFEMLYHHTMVNTRLNMIIGSWCRSITHNQWKAPMYEGGSNNHGIVYTIAIRCKTTIWSSNGWHGKGNLSMSCMAPTSVHTDDEIKFIPQMCVFGGVMFLYKSKLNLLWVHISWNMNVLLWVNFLWWLNIWSSGPTPQKKSQASP